MPSRSHEKESLELALLAAKVRKETAQASIAELDLRRLQGGLVDYGQVTGELVTACLTLRRAVFRSLEEGRVSEDVVSRVEQDFDRFANSFSFGEESAEEASEEADLPMG